MLSQANSTPCCNSSTHDTGRSIPTSSSGTSLTSFLGSHSPRLRDPFSDEDRPRPRTSFGRRSRGRGSAIATTSSHRHQRPSRQRLLPHHPSASTNSNTAARVDVAAVLEEAMAITKDSLPLLSACRRRGEEPSIKEEKDKKSSH